MTVMEATVRAVYGHQAKVVSCTPSIYSTSHPIDDVVVDVGDGRTVALLRKDVAGHLPGTDAAKPAFLRDAGREQRVYRHLLARVDVGAPRLIGAGEGWLLLEKVPGVELYQVGDVGVWRAVAEAVAAMHRSFSDDAERQMADPTLGLLRHDAVAIDGWITLASTAFPGASRPRWLEALRQRYGEVRDCLLTLPQTIVHGELYASNVLVDGITVPPRRVCPIDWEMAALGPGLMDLAALVAGSWDDADRRAIASGYLAAFPTLGEDDLDVCRLHVAVQWLGWSTAWRPPLEHAHSWLTEARELGERLKLI